jgi:hypothetical protein
MENSTATKRRERRLAARTERERIASSNRKKAALRKQLTIGGIVAVVLAVSVLLFNTVQDGMRPAPGVTLPNEGNSHVTPGTPLEYRSNPPASGPHYATWARPGFYNETLDRGLWVHSLEHGYVVLLYNCPTECPDLVQQLRQFYDTAPKSARYGYQKLIVMPYQEMDHRIAVVAWTRLDQMDQLDLQRVGEFYRRYHDRGPEDAS